MAKTFPKNIIFEKRYFNLGKAHKWLAENNYSADAKLTEKTNTYNFALYEGAVKSLETTSPVKGVQVIAGVPIAAESKSIKIKGLCESSRFLEAFDDADTKMHIARVVLITEGLGNRRNMCYYSADLLKSSAAMFEGKPSFLDHPDEMEMQIIPERRVKDKVGFFKNVKVEAVEGKTALTADMYFDLSDAGKLAYDKAMTAIEYKKIFPSAEDVYVGLSINADGDCEERKMDFGGEELTVQYVKQFTEVESVDMVTKPARGGDFNAMLESMRTNSNSEDKMKVKKFIESLRDFLKQSKDIKSLEKFLKEADEKCQSEGEGEDEGKLKGKQDEGEAEGYEALKAKHEALTKKMEGIDNLITELTNFLRAEKDEGHETEAKPKGDEPPDEPTKPVESDRAAYAELAIKAMLREANVPENKMKAFDISALAGKKLAEAKASIERTLALMDLPTTTDAKSVNISDGDFSKVFGEKLSEFKKK